MTEIKRLLQEKYPEIDDKADRLFGFCYYYNGEDTDLTPLTPEENAFIFSELRKVKHKIKEEVKKECQDLKEEEVDDTVEEEFTGVYINLEGIFYNFNILRFHAEAIDICGEMFETPPFSDYKDYEGGCI